MEMGRSEERRSKSKPEVHARAWPQLPSPLDHIVETPISSPPRVNPEPAGHLRRDSDSEGEGAAPPSKRRTRDAGDSTAQRERSATAHAGGDPHHDEPEVKPPLEEPPIDLGDDGDGGTARPTRMIKAISMSRGDIASDVIYGGETTWDTRY